MQVDFLQLRVQAAVEQHCSWLAPRVYETGMEYFDWLLGNRDLALSTLAKWIRRPTSQFSGLDATVALISEKPVGVFIGIPGREVPNRQRADVLALIKDSKSHEREDLKRRLLLLANMEAPVEPADFYIRTLVVDAAHRGAGLGRLLLERCLEDATLSGFRRFRIDVRSDNAPAMRLYLSIGFRGIREIAAPHLGSLCKLASLAMER